MTIELRMLAFSAILGIVQLLLAAQASTMQRGFKWNMGNRDEKAPELTGVAARLDRAFKNFLESFAIFVAAIAVVHLANRLGPMSTLGAQLYFFARLIYLPVYAAGVKGLRSLIWLASMVGIALVLFAALVE